jgi:signal peptidase I
VVWFPCLVATRKVTVMRDSETTKPADRTVRRKKVAWWQETIILLVVAIVVSALVKAFFVQMFFVPSGSMIPQFALNDRILVEKISYWTGDPDRGDVVVFRDPGNWLGVAPKPTGLQGLLSTVGLYPAGGHLVKRVIGVGGDHVECCDDQGRLMVNGVPVDESTYLRKGVNPSDQPFDIVVPADHLWMMGDNRSNSEDSRAHQSRPGEGMVPVEDVVGKVWAIVWPAGRMEVLDDPAAFDNPDLDGDNK